MNKKTVFALSSLLILSVISIFPVFHTQVASAAGVMRDFYVATEYGLGGSGYNVFYPQTLVVEQGDQVNITVRNVGTESFTLNIEGQSSVAIQPGSQNASGIQPADTDVPILTASTPGIFRFSADKFPEMNGQLVVLPTDASSYNPSTQTRSFTQLVLPTQSGTAASPPPQTPGALPLSLLVLLSIALLIVGVLIGAILAARFNREKTAP